MILRLVVFGSGAVLMGWQRHRLKKKKKKKKKKEKSGKTARRGHPPSPLWPGRRPTNTRAILMNAASARRAAQLVPHPRPSSEPAWSRNSDTKA